MQAALMGIKIVSALSSTDLLMTALSRSTQNLSFLLGCINKYDHQHINLELKRIDIEMRLKIIEAFLSDIKQEDEKIIILCIESLQEIINEIHVIINKIYDKIRYNQSLYLFKSFRTVDCKKYTQRLEVLSTVLDKRFDITRDLLKLYNIRINKDNNIEKIKPKVNKIEASV